MLMIMLKLFVCLNIVAGGVQEGATEGGDASSERGPRKSRHPASRLR